MLDRTGKRRFVVTLGILASLIGLPTRATKGDGQPPRPRTTRYTDYQRLTLALPDAFRNERDLTLHLGVHNGRVLQAWGELEGVDRVIDHFDVNDLKVTRDRLSGQVVMTVHVPAEEKIYRCRLEIDARRSGERILGRFAGRTAVRGGELVFKRSKGILEPEDVDYFVYGERCQGEIDVLAMKPRTVKICGPSVTGCQSVGYGVEILPDFGRTRC